ncbi:MAG: OsmC family protein [Bacteroidales bacterium]|nr:OsmC family protein [Bacteroidales bacterium]
MKESISLSWIDEMAFETELNGHKLVIDANESVGGKDRGPRPKPLMMLALAGCTGMDVVSILKKMRVEYKNLEIKVEGELSEEHPKRYIKMKIVYVFTGENLPLAKIQKAVDLSKDRYCGVSVSYKESMELEYEIVLNQ